MKYFPIFRARQYELLALRELAESIAAKSIIPVLEPVKATNPLLTALTTFVEAGMEFGFIVNPKVPTAKKALSQDTVYKSIISGTLDEFELFRPTFYVDGQTTPKEVQAFISRFSDLERAYFLTSDPSIGTIKAINDDKPIYILFRAPKISATVRGKFPHPDRVLVEDPFVSRNNADYPPVESFSDRHLGTASGDYAHFGDYSIVGDIFKETGGLPFAVTIHYMAARKSTAGELDLRHYVSDQIETRGRAPEKFLEALDKLIEGLPALGTHNRTASTDEFKRLHDEQHFPGLAVLKKLAMKRHIEMIAKLL